MDHQSSNFITSEIVKVEAQFKLLWKVNEKDSMNVHIDLKIVETLLSQRSRKTPPPPPPENYHS